MLPAFSHSATEPRPSVPPAFPIHTSPTVPEPIILRTPNTFPLQAYLNLALPNHMHLPYMLISTHLTYFLSIHPSTYQQAYLNLVWPRHMFLPHLLICTHLTHFHSILLSTYPQAHLNLVWPRHMYLLHLLKILQSLSLFIIIITH